MVHRHVAAAAGRGALVIGPGSARRVVGSHVEIVGGAGTQAGDRVAGGAAAQAGDLRPGAVDPLIDQVTGGAGNAVPRQVDLRCGNGRGRERRSGGRSELARGRGALVIRPGRSGRVVGSHVKIVRGAGTQAGDRVAGVAAAQAGDLLPGAVDPVIDQVTAGAATRPVHARLICVPDTAVAVNDGAAGAAKADKPRRLLAAVEDIDANLPASYWFAPARRAGAVKSWKGLLVPVPVVLCESIIRGSDQLHA